MMDRFTFGRKTLNGQRSAVDRFVPSREYSLEQRRRHRAAGHPAEHTPWNTNNMEHKKYASCLHRAFDMDPQEQLEADVGQHWPCRPRKKCYLSSADSVLDLPNYSYAAFPELLDWSNDNILVAALGRNYHRWSWRTQSLINQGFSLREIRCCKFDPRGDKLILGTYLSTVEVHNNRLSKLVASNYCICVKRDQEYCSITAVDWSPTGNSFVTGCSRGKVVSFARNSQQISWHDASDSAIFLVRVSPNARYVAVTAVNSNTVKILLWPSLKRYWNLLGQNHVMKTITWHPWRSAFLGIGSDKVSGPQRQASVALLDVPSCRPAVTALYDAGPVVDTMLFSDQTGELVMSMWNAGEESTMESTLMVRSDARTVVDAWGAGRGLERVRSMLFSPDGTKLATATAGEDLIIWNFLPEDRKNKAKIQRFSALPHYLDKVTYGLSIR